LSTPIVVYSDDHVPARTRSTLGTYHPRTERSGRVERAFRATKMSFLRPILDGAALRLDRRGRRRKRDVLTQAVLQRAARRTDI
jgi:hypothetical protein